MCGRGGDMFVTRDAAPRPSWAYCAAFRGVPAAPRLGTCHPGAGGPGEAAPQPATLRPSRRADMTPSTCLPGTTCSGISPATPTGTSARSRGSGSHS